MKKLKTLSDAALLKKEQSSKFSTYILIALLIIALIFSISHYLKNGFSNTSVMPVLALAMAGTNYQTLRSIRKEKKERLLE